MSGAKLHAYDLALCDYAVGTIQGNMHGDDKFTKVVRFAGEPQELWGYVRLSIDDPNSEPGQMLLNDDEFYSLIDYFESQPISSDRPWIASRDLHRRYVHTLVEVRRGLASAAADQWAEVCASSSRELEQAGVRLAAGLSIVHDWVQELRELLRAMEAVRYLPRPDAPVPTPSSKSSGTTLLAPTAPEQVAIEAMRAAIRALSPETKPDVLIARAKIRQDRARKALRWLEKLGEYAGFTREAKRKS